MAARRGIALVCIALPVCALLSLGCGIFMLPVAGPKAALHNAQRIEFTLHVVGEDGKPLDGVTATISRHKDTVMIFGEYDQTDEPEQQQVVHGELHYKSVGAYAVEVALHKAGYQRVYLVCGNAPGVPMEETFWIGRFAPGERIDVKEHPDVVVQMMRAPPEVKPESAATETAPPPPGPTYPTTR